MCSLDGVSIDHRGRQLHSAIYMMMLDPPITLDFGFTVDAEDALINGDRDVLGLHPWRRDRDLVGRGRLTDQGLRSALALVGAPSLPQLKGVEHGVAIEHAEELRARSEHVVAKCLAQGRGEHRVRAEEAVSKHGEWERELEGRVARSMTEGVAPMKRRESERRLEPSSRSTI